MQTRLAATVLVAAALCTWPVQAQETLTLEDVLARVQQQSGRLAEFEARRAAADAVAAARSAARMPSASLLGGYTRTNHVQEFSIAVPGQPPRVIYPDVPDNARTRIDLQWPIYTGGRAEALVRGAREEASAVGEDLEAVKADLRLDATRAFWALVTARETERVVARALESVDAHLRDLRSRFEQGLIAPNDVTSAEAQRSRQRLLAIEASNTRAVAEADMRRLIGGDGPITPAADLESGAANVAPAPTGAERKALSFRVGAAEARAAAASAAYKPQVTFGGGYDVARPNPRIFPRAGRWEDSWDASINVAWTLWDGGRRSADRAEASASTRAVKARLSEFERQVAFELQQRRLELASAAASIEAASDGVRSAAETKRVVGERYRAGVVTSTDVMDAEVALLQAELDRTRALAATKLAQARLERAAAR
jgi:outer membrane protein